METYSYYRWPIKVENDVWFLVKAVPADGQVSIGAGTPVTYFTKDINSRLAKRPLVFNGR